MLKHAWPDPDTITIYRSIYLFISPHLYISWVLSTFSKSQSSFTLIRSCNVKCMQISIWFSSYSTRESEHHLFFSIFQIHTCKLHNERDGILPLEDTESVSAGVRSTPYAPGYDAMLEKGWEKDSEEACGCVLACPISVVYAAQLWTSADVIATKYHTLSFTLTCLFISVALVISVFHTFYLSLFFYLVLSLGWFFFPLLRMSLIHTCLQFDLLYIPDVSLVSLRCSFLWMQLAGKSLL